MGIVIFDFPDKPRNRCTHGKTSQVAGGVGQLCCYTTLRSHDQAYVVLPWASKVSAAITHEQAIKDNRHQIIISRGIRECTMGPAIPANQCSPGFNDDLDGARLCRDLAPPDPVTEFDTEDREVLKILVPFVT